MTKEEIQNMGIESLPETLNEALSFMQKEPLVKNVLGEHAYKAYLACKKKEWDEYKTYVSRWELDRYMIY